MAIQLVIDSVADLTHEEIHDTIILPLPVIIDGKEYIPFENLTPRQFYELQAQAKEFPKTSQVPYPVIESTFRKIIEEGNKVCAIFIGSKHSGTYNSACLARDNLIEEGVGTIEDYAIIDSKNVTFPLAALCLEARRLIDEGKMSLAEIEERLNYLVPRIHMRAVINDLTYLKKGGRISGVTHAFASLLGFKVVVKTGNNEIAPTNKVRGTKKGLMIVVDTFKNEDVDFSLPFYAGHSNDPELGKEMVSLFEKETGQKVTLTVDIGPVVGAHAGPGCTGVCWFVK